MNVMHHTLPALPYTPEALEPWLDARTVAVHHGEHHAFYVQALNRVMSLAPESLWKRSAAWLLQHLQEVPIALRTAVRHHAGGHFNHSLLWQSMSPAGGGKPAGRLAAAIDAAFGSFDEFKASFEEAGARHLGVGWVWLVRSQHGSRPLRVLTTALHENPLSFGHLPLLNIDLWEHAYYLRYEHRRSDYLKSWWSVVDWEGAAHRLDHDPSGAAEVPPAPGNAPADPPLAQDAAQGR